MRHLGRPLLAILGLSVGAICLWLAMRGVDWREVGRIFRAADIRPIAAGIALYGAGMLMRAGRWRAILSFRSPIGLAVTLKSLLAGYAVNSILPARLGELFRTDYMARQTGLSRSGVLASIFVERLLDLIVVVGMLALGLAIVGGGSHAVLEVLAVGVLVMVVAVCGLYFIGTRLSAGGAEAFVSAVFGRLPGGQTIVRLLAPRLGDFAQLLQKMRGPRFARVAAVTLPIWAVEAMAVWLICRAADVDLGPAALLCLMGVANLSTLMPTAPAYAGSFQFAYVVVLAGFGVDATTAVAAATTVQLYVIGGFTLLGLLTLAVATVLAPRRAR